LKAKKLKVRKSECNVCAVVGTRHAVSLHYEIRMKFAFFISIFKKCDNSEINDSNRIVDNMMGIAHPTLNGYE